MSDAPKIEAHVVGMETISIPSGEGHYDTKWRWRCSCGEIGKRWRYEIRNARNGGARHIAAMERGR